MSQTQNLIAMTVMKTTEEFTIITTRGIISVPLDDFPEIRDVVGSEETMTWTDGGRGIRFYEQGIDLSVSALAEKYGFTCKPYQPHQS